MRTSRIALMAATQLCWAMLASATACALDARAAWSDLWRTPDQQGQALLDAGQPAQAAERFHDPHRRAYADLEAGRYRDAARLLAPYTDARSEYNRGNALAKGGQLQAALTAYDAALKQAPGDKDIRHNRDLVERALQQRQRSPQSSSRNGRQGNHGAGSSGKQQSGGGQKGGSGSRPSDASGAQSSSDSRAASSGSQAGAGPARDSGRQQPGGGSISPGAGDSQAAGASGSAASKEPPGQARRDAATAAAFAREQQQRNAAGKSGRTSNGAARGPDSGLLQGGTQTPKQNPESERQLALDQWLRQIPDSPAGLLQRKFLIEHMMKQQDGGNPQESGQ